uniref:Polyhydroxybutyrate depolymerase n=1 Tax=Palpitomonas bilix TaxID=652834 RepID=A0A7S3DDX1_9EUKA|mmetsp:Transcript_31158/g.81754  ORF Transcript_31158/g.81754 Transcript_31158/m.81754 type:complete len:331 (+) Transcript_31158:26-1018(+)
MRGLFFCSFALFLLAIPCVVCSDRLNEYGVDKENVAVAGISSGGFMSVQLHVIFSSLFRGAGVTAGGPFGCAGGVVSTALTACMSTPSLISVDALVTATAAKATDGLIANPSFLKGSQVFLFSGTKDTVVDQGVVKKLQSYYERFGADIETMYDVESEHAHITSNYGNECGHLGSPYINNCGIDVSGKIMQKLFGGDLYPPVNASDDSLHAFDQSEFTTVFTTTQIGLGDRGFVYVPERCNRKDSKCKLLVALHGCEMGYDQIGKEYVQHVGYNEWAESNDMIVLYPQATTNTLNPNGCFDWWGYAGVNYATNQGTQVMAIKKMVDRVMN